MKGCRALTGQHQGPGQVRMDRGREGWASEGEQGAGECMAGWQRLCTLTNPASPPSDRVVRRSPLSALFITPCLPTATGGQENRGLDLTLGSTVASICLEMLVEWIMMEETQWQKWDSNPGSWPPCFPPFSLPLVTASNSPSELRCPDAVQCVRPSNRALPLVWGHFSGRRQ